MDTTVNQISEDLLLNVKLNQPIEEVIMKLKVLSYNSLNHSLVNDDLKKAFWINIYNAYYQILRTEQNISKENIYTTKSICVGQKMFSLDDIEHGILRRFRYKYSLGLLPNLLIPKYVRKLAVDKLDYRIHFALNCGAKSCPPIGFYNPHKIDAQLDLATSSFLESETDFDKKTKTVYVTRLFLWFKFDFGRLKGIQKVFQKHLQKDIKGYSIKYKEYSWEDDLHNFT